MNSIPWVQYPSNGVPVSFNFNIARFQETIKKLDEKTPKALEEAQKQREEKQKEKGKREHLDNKKSQQNSNGILGVSFPDSTYYLTDFSENLAQFREKVKEFWNKRKQSKKTGKKRQNRKENGIKFSLQQPIEATKEIVVKQNRLQAENPKIFQRLHNKEQRRKGKRMAFICCYKSGKGCFTDTAKLHLSEDMLRTIAIMKRSMKK